MKNNYFKKADQYQLNLNLMCQSYKKLKPAQKNACKIQLLTRITNQMANFQKKISKICLKKLNLIAGNTGSGKSTLFDYLNKIPLKVVERVIEGLNGKRKNTGIAVLEVDTQIWKGDYAKISSGYASQTTFPNFMYYQAQDTVYVDCPGQFDNRSFFQSLINSFIRYRLASSAAQVKITVVINYQTLINERGTAFKKVLQQIQNFIGSWRQFQNSQCFSLVVSNAPRKSNICQILFKQLGQIQKNITDIGKFQFILKDIIKRQAVAIFLSPDKKIKNFIEYNNGEQQPIFQIGGRYQDNQMVNNKIISSSEIIRKMLDRTRFMKCAKDSFAQNLQQNVLNIINDIVHDMLTNLYEVILRQIKSDILSRYLSIKAGHKEEFYQRNKQELRRCKNVQNLIQLIKNKSRKLKVDQQLKKFKIFQNIPNVKRIHQIVIPVINQIQILIQEEINKIIIAQQHEQNKKMKDLQKKSEAMKRMRARNQERSDNSIKEIYNKINKLKCHYNRYPSENEVSFEQENSDQEEYSDQEENSDQESSEGKRQWQEDPSDNEECYEQENSDQEERQGRKSSEIKRHCKKSSWGGSSEQLQLEEQEGYWKKQEQLDDSREQQHSSIPQQILQGFLPWFIPKKIIGTIFQKTNFPDYSRRR